MNLNWQVINGEWIHMEIALVQVPTFHFAVDPINYRSIEWLINDKEAYFFVDSQEQEEQDSPILCQGGPFLLPRSWK